MAIWTPSEGATPRFGVLRGDVWAAGQGSPTLANMPRGANKLARRNFRSWTKRAVWEAEWELQSGGQKVWWNDYAEDNLQHRLTGQPRIVTGAELFATYWSQAELFQGSTPAGPYDPPDPPDWNVDTSPFEPWLDAGEGMAVVVQSETTAARTFFFAGQPPIANKQKLVRSTMVPLGTFTLDASAAGTRWDAPTAAAEALWGSAARSAEFQQWFLAWELSHWWPRPVLDPCYSPPVGGTTPSTITFDGTIDGYGPYAEEFTWNAVDEIYEGRDYFNYANIEVTAGGTFWHVQIYAPGELYFFDGFKPGSLASPLGAYTLDAFGGSMTAY